MSVTLLTTASRIFPKMLEDTAFLFSEEPESSLVFDKAPVGIGIAYTGPEEGELRVWAQPSFMRVLAANMLGIDESDPNVESRCMDALGELLNIVLGHCLTERFGENEPMMMGLPRNLDERELADDLHAGYWLSVEGEPFLLAWKDRR